ncbi:MAG: Mov34/MPN/PAD-1 family protein [Candidatus Desantisbacteria bacterium]
MIINAAHMQEIYSHVKEAYPNECCGVLIGKLQKITRVMPVQNINKDRSHDRYEMSPDELYKIDKYARSKGWDIIGFYHSHPDHPAHPSAFDKEMAVNGYIYLIVSIDKEHNIKTGAWIFEEESDLFQKIKLTVMKKVSKMYIDKQVDIRGEVCPYTYVKSKLAMEGLEAGEVLEIILDHKPAIENVPRSMENEGHTVLSVSSDDQINWKIVVKKGDKK